MNRARATWLSCDRGVIAPATAVLLAVLVGMVGLVTDTSVWYAQRRQLQAATDAAALAAAPHADDVGAARNAANAMLIENGLDPDEAVTSFAIGQYCADQAVGQRFRTAGCPGAIDTTTGNAVRIETGLGTPLFLSRLFTASATDERRISTVSTAARINQAGLQAGSGLASLNAGLANALLTSLTGSSVSLTLAQYDGLIRTQVDALTFFDALATRVGVTAGTYGQLAQSSVGVRDVLAAQAAALAAQNQVADAAAAIAGLQALQGQIAGNPTIALGTLFDLGLWKTRQVGQATSASALHAGINVMQLTSFTLQAANGANGFAVPSSSVGIPGVAGVRIAATAIEPPVGARFAFGSKGISVHTAQVRMKLEATVAGISTIPLYIEAAHGDATIDDIDCDGDPTADTQVEVTAHSGIATVYLGTLPTNVMTNFSTPITAAMVQPAPLVGLLNLITVNAKARVPVGAGSGSLLFKQPGQAGGSGVGFIGRPAGNGQAAIAPVPATVGTRSYATPLLAGLASSLTLTACILNCTVSVALNAGQVNTVTNTLRPILVSLDGVVDGLLTTLGLQLGYVDVAVTGARCGVPVLVS